MDDAASDSRRPGDMNVHNLEPDRFGDSGEIPICWDHYSLQDAVPNHDKGSSAAAKNEPGGLRESVTVIEVRRRIVCPSAPAVNAVLWVLPAQNPKSPSNFFICDSNSAMASMVGG